MKKTTILNHVFLWVLLTFGVGLVDHYCSNKKGESTFAIMFFSWSICVCHYGLGHLNKDLRLHKEYRLEPTCGTIWKKRPTIGYDAISQHCNATTKQLP